MDIDIDDKGFSFSEFWEAIVRNTYPLTTETETYLIAAQQGENIQW